MPGKKRSASPKRAPSARRKATPPSDEVIIVEEAENVEVVPSSLPVLTGPPVTYWMKVAAGVIVVIALANMIVAIKQILILILVSLILAIGLQPGVNWLVRKGIRRSGAVALIFVVSVGVVLGFLALVIPVVIRQIADLVDKAPEYLDRAQEKYKFIADLNDRYQLAAKLRDLAGDLPSTVLSLVRSFTALVFNLLTVLILTLYFTTALPTLEHGITRLLRRDDREDFERILAESTTLVGGYMLGIFLVGVIAGFISFLALAILGVPYPAALAFWVSLTALIPTVGAYLGAAPAVLVAAFAGVPRMIATLAFFLIYQQIENYVISPRIMSRAIQMSAAAVIVAVLIGATLAGFPGALLALPAAAIIKVVIQRLFLEGRLEAVRLADAETTVDRGAEPRRRLRLRRRH